MFKESPQFKAEPHPSDEVTVILKSFPKKGLGWLARMRGHDSERISRYCIHFLGTKEFDSNGRQMAAWLSNGDSYGALLLDPDLLTIEEAKQAAKIMRATDPKFTTKLLRGLPEQSPVEVLSRALIILDTACKTVPSSRSYQAITQSLALACHRFKQGHPCPSHLQFRQPVASNK